MIDLRDLLAAVDSTVERHSLGLPGAYRRWLWQDDAGGRDLGVNEYGCADAANLLYTIRRFPGRDEQAQWVAVMQEQQDPETGLFREQTHDPIHTTAHVIAALELFETRPKYPLVSLAPLKERSRLESFLEDLDWTWNPWGDSHRGAGIYAALVLAGEAPEEWEDWYFEWLWHETDPDTGFWRKGKVEPGGDAILFHHLAGSFHYLFNHEHARRPLRHPERMVDSCLRIYAQGLFPPLGQTVGFAEIDWVYCLNRSLRQCGYRLKECQQALREFAERYVEYLASLDLGADDGFNDLHQLFGAVCALAELQQALPGAFRTDRPLRLVLDRRPFI